MAKPLSILYVSSEVFPFAKIGGIGDIAYSLPIAIRDQGHDIRVMLPKYGIVSERRNKIHEINRLKDMPIPVGNDTMLATVKSSAICNPRTKVQAYITTNQDYFDSKKGIYGDPKCGVDYPDNDERFMFFSRTVIETCMLLGWYPDIIHCNDWQTALAAAFAKILFPNKFKKTRFVLTVHNFAQQGEFPEATFDKLALPEDVKENFMHDGKVNFLKAGIMYADYINTVSQTYADEILQDSNYTKGLNKIMLQNTDKFSGIMNGIDTYGWNPRTDNIKKKKLTDDFEEYKEINKAYLANQFGLEYKPRTPMIGIVTKLSDYKGTDLLLKTLPKLCELDLQLIVMGDGEQKFKQEIQEQYKHHFDKFAFKIGFDEDLTHNIEAGCDMYLMPSLYEPCGLNAMYSMLYGTVPIVRATGGLTEIVKEFDTETRAGNGFKFSDYTPEALFDVVAKAIAIYKRRDIWYEFSKRLMKEDFSWKESAKKYITIYYNTFKD